MNDRAGWESLALVERGLNPEIRGALESSADAV